MALKIERCPEHPAAFFENGHIHFYEQTAGSLRPRHNYFETI